MIRPGPEQASQYAYFVPITTRWMDNDAYGHINNVVFYSFFDTAANHYLIHEGGLHIETSPVIGLVVESRCRYHAPIQYPTEVRAGVRVDRLGDRSVTYGVAIFAGADEQASADGLFVHVFVDRLTRRPVAIPPTMREALQRILRLEEH
ncbi:MAG: acyl-CoA thioesterase [Polyangiaceae bacterium]|nr:acyl-CoA thioesterase [Polyangiaceae bacterium]